MASSGTRSARSLTFDDVPMHLKPRIKATITGWSLTDQVVNYDIQVNALEGEVVGSSSKRFSAFRELHEQIKEDLGLAEFPVWRWPLNNAALRDSRVIELERYLEDVLSVVAERDRPLPVVLQQFLGLNRTSAVISKSSVHQMA